MTISKGVKVWIIVNSVILSIVPILFILGLLYSKHWVEIIKFANILSVVLFLHIFYQGFYIGAFVSIITLSLLIGQICNYKKSGVPLPTLWTIGEVFIILLGFFDVLPITSRIIADLYYIIPGW